MGVKVSGGTVNIVEVVETEWRAYIPTQWPLTSDSGPQSQSKMIIHAGRNPVKRDTSGRASCGSGEEIICVQSVRRNHSRT